MIKRQWRVPHLPHRQRAAVLSGRQRATLVQPEGFRSLPMCSKGSDSIPRPGKGVCNSQRHTEITYLTSVGPPIIPPPSQSQPPPHDQGSSSIERSWERGERRPGLSSRKKGEHRSKVDRAVVSTSNKKCLHYLDCSQFLKLWCYPCGGKDGASVACPDIRKLGKLFDKKKYHS